MQEIQLRMFTPEYFPYMKSHMHTVQEIESWSPVSLAWETTLQFGCIPNKGNTKTY